MGRPRRGGRAGGRGRVPGAARGGRRGPHPPSRRDPLSAPPKPRRYDLSCAVDAYRDGWTLADFLAARFRYHPPDLWRERIASGCVRRNGAPAAGDDRVAKGDRIEYTIWHAEPEVDFAFRVLHEDAHVLAVAKSGNLPVHAGGKFIRNTLIAKLRELRGERELRPAHRLDRETSGVVVLARSAEAARFLEAAFRERRVAKRYVAVLRGAVPPAWTVDAPIARREPARPPYFRVVEPGSGKPSATVFRLLAQPAPAAAPAAATGATPRGELLSLVEAIPAGGRTNQIRVHAAHAGYPILGDKIYGIPEPLAREFVDSGPTPAVLAAAGAPRHLLHCLRLAIPHPEGGELALVAPLPPDLLEAAAFALPGGFPDS